MIVLFNSGENIYYFSKRERERDMREKSLGSFIVLKTKVSSLSIN